MGVKELRMSRTKLPHSPTSDKVLIQVSTWYFCEPLIHEHCESRKAPRRRRTNTGCRDWKKQKKRKQLRKTYHPMLLISVSWIPSHLELRNGVVYKFLQNKARSLLKSYGSQDLRSRKILFFWNGPGTKRRKRRKETNIHQTKKNDKSPDLWILVVLCSTENSMMGDAITSFISEKSIELPFKVPLLLC